MIQNILLQGDGEVQCTSADLRIGFGRRMACPAGTHASHRERRDDEDPVAKA